MSGFRWLGVTFREGVRDEVDRFRQMWQKREWLWLTTYVVIYGIFFYWVFVLLAGGSS